MSDMALSPARHRITIDEYHRMADAGIFDPNVRLELIDGDLIESRVTMKPPHAAVVQFLTRTLTVGLGDRAVVRCRLPVTLGDLWEPEPDFAIVRAPGALYCTRHPGAADTLAIIEVADASRDFDVGRKVPIYAQSGIPETWIVDLVDSCIRIFRDPQGATYADTTVAPITAEVSLRSFADVKLHMRGSQPN